MANRAWRRPTIDRHWLIRGDSHHSQFLHVGVKLSQKPTAKGNGPFANSDRGAVCVKSCLCRRPANEQYAGDAVEPCHAREPWHLGADRPTVDRCNGAIAEWAAQYTPVSISSTLREPVRSTADGQHTATLLVRIKYLRQGGIEPREATINCTVRADGTVSVVPVG